MTVADDGAPDGGMAGDQAVGQTGDRAGDLAGELRAAKEQIERITAEFEDLKLLYDAMIEHGEAVEDQLTENNELLQRTQRRLEAELADAARYVQSILPVPRRETPVTDWLLVPSTELGGDSFGYHEIDADHIAFYLLDVCGHGVGAALLSVTVINVLRASALPNTNFRDPTAVFDALDHAFPMERQNNMFFTMWYGVYRRSTRQLCFATAGHPPAIHLRPRPDGSREARHLITWGGFAIGTFAGMERVAETVTMEPGDRILILSDGTFEVNTDGDDMLEFSEFVSLVARPGGDEPAAVYDHIRALNGEGALPDDFSLLRVEF